MNVLENCTISPRKVLKASKKEAEEKALSILETVGMKEFAYQSVNTLSGGQKQRVAIARALINNPKILLCDEATSALDPTTADQILDLLKNLNKELGLTIIIIAHQMSVIERVCNKVAILSDHKVVECGPVSEVFLNPQTKAARKLIYSGHVATKFHDSRLIKFEFNGDTNQPLIANIIQECNILVSIVYANSWVVDDKIYGQLMIKLPYHEKDIDRLKTYLDLKNIAYKEVESDELGDSLKGR
jgi:D-methionine transport system ATP-binding protein